MENIQSTRREGAHEADEHIIENMGQPAIRLPQKSFNNDADAIQVQNLGIDVIGASSLV